MRSFDLTLQIERLIAAGIGRIQRIQDDVYRNLWPKSVDLPEKHEGRFDRALIVDAFPMYPMHTAVDHGGRRVTLPVRLFPLPGKDKPNTEAFSPDMRERLEPLRHSEHEDLLRYVIFWQAGERWKGCSPNAVRSRFDADECALGLNEALHLPLQEEALLRARHLPITDLNGPRGETFFIHWDGPDGDDPYFTAGYGMYASPQGVPSRAKEVLPVSTEHQDFFLKE